VPSNIKCYANGIVTITRLAIIALMQLLLSCMRYVAVLKTATVLGLTSPT
jgi:hypothetical protein